MMDIIGYYMMIRIYYYTRNILLLLVTIIHFISRGCNRNLYTVNHYCEG